MLMVMDSIGRDYRKDFNILLWRSGEYSTPNKKWAVFFINIFLQHTGTWGLLVYYIIFYNILVWSATSQTPLWRTRSKIRTRDRRSRDILFNIGLYYIIPTVLQCDLPPLRPHCGEAPGRDSNPGRAAQRQGHYP